MASDPFLMFLDLMLIIIRDIPPKGMSGDKYFQHSMSNNFFEYKHQEQKIGHNCDVWMK